MSSRRSHTALVIAIALAACDRPPEPEASPSPKPNPTTATAPPASGPASGDASPKPKGPQDIAWDVPAAWQKSESPTPMRLFTYKIPHAKADSEDAEMSVSRAGGSVDMNVQRWSGQFEDKKPDGNARKERMVGELKVTTVEIHGTFAGSGMPGAAAGAPKKNYALLGAIVEVGSSPYFFKLTGPEATVVAAKADFDKLVESFRPK